MPNDVLPRASRSDLQQPVGPAPGSPRDVAPPVPLLLVGNADSRRVTAFQTAARQFPQFDVRLLTYRELLQAGVEQFDLEPGTVVRLESPSEDDITQRLLLQAGIEPMERLGRVPIPAAAIEQLATSRGEVLHPLQWHLGYCRLLENLDRRWSPAGVRWMSTPAVITTAFDKRTCKEIWARAGLPVIPGHESVTTYAALRQQIPDRRARLFVKLRYGYSAVGAMALEWHASRVRAITTVEVTWSEGRPRLYLSKRPRMLSREFEIAWLFDTLAAEDIVVEDWLPKLRYEGHPFDVRIVMIDGQPAHIVGRSSDSPFTNLNLDARRLSAACVADRVGPYWEEVLTISRRAAAALPGAHMLGLDVLLSPSRAHCHLLEANAFGDYLPNLLQAGRSTHEAELHAWWQHARVDR